MVDAEFFDAFLTAGYMPNERTVTVNSADGVTAVNLRLTARREPATEQQREIAGITAGEESVVFFFAAGQENFVRPRLQWGVTDTGGDGSKWVVKHDDLTISDRGVPVVCVRDRT